MGVNKAILIGNLGKDPEVRYTGNQLAVGRFSLATTEKKKDQSGNWVDHTEWHNVVTFGKQAEFAQKWLKKGRQVYVEGRIQTNKWQDKEGKDRYTTEIIANTVQFVGNAPGKDAGMAGSAEEVASGKSLLGSLQSADAVASGSVAGGKLPVDEDDIPF